MVCRRKGKETRKGKEKRRRRGCQIEREAEKAGRRHRDLFHHLGGLLRAAFQASYQIRQLDDVSYL